MGRSLKKGPFVNAKLLKAIEELNAANEKKKCNYSPLYFMWIKVLFYGSLLFFFVGKKYIISRRIIIGHIEL